MRLVHAPRRGQAGSRPRRCWRSAHPADPHLGKCWLASRHAPVRAVPPHGDEPARAAPDRDWRQRPRGLAADGLACPQGGRQGPAEQRAAHGANNRPPPCPRPLGRAWTLVSTQVPPTMGPPHTVVRVSPRRRHVAWRVKAWNSALPGATRKTPPADTPVCDRSGRRRFRRRNAARCPPRRATRGRQRPRARRLWPLVRQLQASAAPWLPALGPPERARCRVRRHAGVSAARLGRKAARKRGTTAPRLREKLDHAPRRWRFAGGRQRFASCVCPDGYRYVTKYEGVDRPAMRSSRTKPVWSARSLPGWATTA